MSAPFDPLSEFPIQECLERLGLALLVDWDVLVFLSRRGASLANAEQIARLLGYPSKAVGEALERLEVRGMILRSRSSQGVRLYRWEEHLVPDDCFRRLMSMAGSRTGRLLLIKHLRPNSGLPAAAAKGRRNEPKRFS